MKEEINQKKSTQTQEKKSSKNHKKENVNEQKKAIKMTLIEDDVLQDVKRIRDEYERNKKKLEKISDDFNNLSKEAKKIKDAYEHTKGFFDDYRFEAQKEINAILDKKILFIKVRTWIGYKDRY